ncbi:MAG: hypothetical protein AB7E32_06090 [Desulfovibrio sp.]
MRPISMDVDEIDSKASLEHDQIVVVLPHIDQELATRREPVLTRRAHTGFGDLIELFEPA